MVRRVLTIYPNCSLGGMTTVYRNRCKKDEQTEFDFVFLNDYGGLSTFESLANTNVRILPRTKLQKYLTYVCTNFDYSQIRITSLPDVVDYLPRNDNTKIIYEFHASSTEILSKELVSLNLSKVDEIWMPSLFLHKTLSYLLNPTYVGRALVIPNIVDISTFSEEGPLLDFSDVSKDSIPLIWVGRFDGSKNYKDYFRILAALPKEYFGIVVASLESNHSRLGEVLYERTCQALDDRLKIFLNFSQEDMASLYRFAVAHKGYFCSTSMAESFGYGVIEASLTGLPVVAYDVGALGEHMEFDFGIKLVSAGRVSEFVHEVKTQTWEHEHERNVKARLKYIEYAEERILK